MSGSKYFKAPAGDVTDPVLSGLLQISRTVRVATSSTLSAEDAIQPRSSSATKNAEARAPNVPRAWCCCVSIRSRSGHGLRQPRSGELAPPIRSFRHLIGPDRVSWSAQADARAASARGQRPFEYELVVGPSAPCRRPPPRCRETEGGFLVLARTRCGGCRDTRDLALQDARRERARTGSLGHRVRAGCSAAGSTPGSMPTARETAVRRDQRTVSAYVRLAQLPDEVLSAFGDRRRIALRWVDKLASALASRRVAVLAAARAGLPTRCARRSRDPVFRYSRRAGSSGAGRTSREETVKVGTDRVAGRIARREGRPAPEQPRSPQAAASRYRAANPRPRWNASWKD